MSGFKPFAEDWPRGGPGTNRVDWQGEIQQGDRLTELDTLADSADYALPGVVRSALRDAAAMIRNLREAQRLAREDEPTWTPTHPRRRAAAMGKRAADSLAYQCAIAVRQGRIGTRSGIADALLDYLDIGGPGGPKSVSEWIKQYVASAQPPPSEGQPE